MKAMSRIKREELFSRYVTNFEILKGRGIYSIEPDISGVFICPLCHRIYTIDALASDDELTLEHVPPKALGGRNVDCTLTCKDCNNEAGSLLDSALKRYLEIDDFRARIPGAKLEVRYSLGEGIWLPATAHANTKDALTLEKPLDPRRSSPKVRQRMLELLQSESGNFQMMHKQPGGRRIGIALLRIGYLYAFRVLGYGLILHPAVQKVKEQLCTPTEDIIPSTWIWPSTPHVADMKIGLNLIRRPKELSSFVVRFDLRTPQQQMKSFAVIIPSPHAWRWNVYEEFQKITSSAESIPVEMISVPEDIKYLTDPDRCFPPL